MAGDLISGNTPLPRVPLQSFDVDIAEKPGSFNAVEQRFELIVCVLCMLRCCRSTYVLAITCLPFRCGRVFWRGMEGVFDFMCRAIGLERTALYLRSFFNANRIRMIICCWARGMLSCGRCILAQIELG